MSLKPMEKWEKPFFDTRMHACPLRTHSTSFQLVDERGDGKPYAGLAYEALDYEGAIYLGVLDETGKGRSIITTAGRWYSSLIRTIKEGMSFIRI